MKLEMRQNVNMPLINYTSWSLCKLHLAGTKFFLQTCHNSLWYEFNEVLETQLT